MYFFLLPTHSPTSVLFYTVKAPLCLRDLCCHTPGLCILYDLCCSRCSPPLCLALIPREQLGSWGGFPFAQSTRGLRPYFYFCESCFSSITVLHPEQRVTEHKASMAASVHCTPSYPHLNPPPHQHRPLPSAVCNVTRLYRPGE